MHNHSHRAVTERGLRRRRHVAGAAGIVALLLLAPAAPARAAAPTVAAGQFTFTSDLQVPTRFPGDNITIAEVAQLSYTGDLSGVAVDVDTFVVHSDGTFQGHGTEVCNPCALRGHTGSFTSTFTFRGSGDSYTGQETVVTSTGELSGLHGTGTFQGLIAENVNTYQYNLQLR